MGHIWSQYQYKIQIYFDIYTWNLILVFNKPIHEGHMYIVVLGKDFDLGGNDSFYCDYTCV
jgi:hypothetical protein